MHILYFNIIKPIFYYINMADSEGFEPDMCDSLYQFIKN
jgi:hypothetical protein